MLQENISTLKKDLSDVYNILNTIDIKTEHYNAKKYSLAMDILSDIFNRIDNIFSAVGSTTVESTTDNPN